MPTDAIPNPAATVAMGRPASPTPLPVAPRPELLAGRYQLVRRVGSGGMGEVFEAEQLSPVRRTVAVKLVRGAAGEDDIAGRLESERQALARMAHPNIAVVHDAGTAPDGRPFVVMEFVHGGTITEYAAEHKLDVPERVELLRTVCAAVQHAHQKGIIHRDLKPGNVLVAHTDAGPVPKVIDFGLAKAVRGRLTANPHLTAAGMVVGTPLYMAPEQTDPAADVDTRADVFALGVILYELLTGRPPLDWLELRHLDAPELIRRVRGVEVVPPSELATASVARQLRGDMDAVVMKALARDPADRYPTAAALADDLRRVLADEPLAIGRTTARVRALRFIRRNRAAVAAGAVLFLALAAGVAGTSVGLARSVRAEAATRGALAQVEAEKAETVLALARVEAERTKTQAARDHTRAALEAATDLKGLGLVTLRPNLSADERAQLSHLADLIDRIDADAITPAERVAWLARVAFLYEKIGDQPRAAGANARAVAAADAGGVEPMLRAGTRLKQARHFALVGRLPEADATFREAIALLAPEAGTDRGAVALIEAHEGLAQTHDRAGRVPEALAETKTTLALAAAARAAGRLHREVTPYVGQSHSRLGILDRKAGRHADAVKHFEDALAAYRAAGFDADDPAAAQFVAAVHLNRGTSLLDLGRLGDAKAASREAIRLAEAALARYPGTIELRVILGTATNNLAGMTAVSGDFADAQRLFARAIETLEPLAGGTGSGDVQAVRSYLNRARFGLAMVKLNLGDDPGEEAVYRSGLAEVQGEERMHFATAYGFAAVKAGRPAVVARCAREVLSIAHPGSPERAAHLFAISSAMSADAQADGYAAAALDAIRRIPHADRPRTPVKTDPQLLGFRQRPGVRDALAGRPQAEAPAPREK